MFKYWGFGLHIASEIGFPELLPATFTEADVTITIGKTPELPEGEVIRKKIFSSITKHEYLLSVKNICKYYAGYGKTIIAAPVPGADERSVRVFLLGTVMAAILYQRGEIPLHASAIVKDGKLIIFAGNSGSGKSTLLAQLLAKGYEAFTDDICILRLQDTHEHSEVVGTASYPMIKLWDNAISELDSTMFTRDFKIRPQLPKYGQFFYETFNQGTLPVDKIFILTTKRPADNASIKKFDGINIFKKLEKQAYKHQLIADTQLKGLYFSLLSRLSIQSPVYEVYRQEGANMEDMPGMLIKYF